MALLQSFPPSNTISPSVRFTETDLTVLSISQSTNSVGLVGYCSKGPINTPTLVTSQTELMTLFGVPHLGLDYPPYLIYAAKICLSQTNSVYIVRVADTDPNSQYYALTANVEVPSAGQLLKVHGALFNPTDVVRFYKDMVTLSNNTDKYFKWALNGVLSSKALRLPWSVGDEGQAIASYTIEQIVAVLNAQLNPAIDGIEFFVYTTASKVALGLSTVWSYGPQNSMEVISVINNLVGGAVSTNTISSGVFQNVNNTLGLSTGSTAPLKSGLSPNYPIDASHGTAGIWEFPTGKYTLQVVVDGSGNVGVDNVFRLYDFSTVLSGSNYLTTAALVADLNTALIALTPSVNNIPASSPPCYQFVANVDSTIGVTTITTDTTESGGLYGRNAKINVRGGTLAAIFDMDLSGATGITYNGVADNTNAESANAFWIGVPNTDPADTSYYTFEVLADSPGIEGNNTFITCTNYTQGSTFTIDVFIYNNNTGFSSQVESWGNLTKNPDSPYYVQTYINDRSNYIRIMDNDATLAPPASTAMTTASVNNLRLAGGSDGYPAGDAAAIDDILIGSPVNLSGIYALSDPEQIDINLVAVPGASSTAVIEAMIDMCEQYRQDCLAIIDPPFGLSPTDVIQWQNGQSQINNQRFDSDFAALYWPWINIYDNYNLVDVLVPPSVGVVAAIIRSDNQSFPWFAPAGLLRGVVPGCIGVAAKPTLAEKDAMYGNGNAINPIVTYANVADFVIWGQKTLQRLPSALDRINVRRMLFYVEKQIRQGCRGLLFQPHTESLRQQFSLLCQGVLNNVQVNQGITAYKVVADETLNTPDVIDRNELRAQIGIVPTRAVEFIYIEFTLYRTGALTANG